MNILSNAFKFTPENGSVDIYLTTGEDKNMYDSLQHYAEIIIADSGIGIPAEEKKHIFERFYQIHNDLNKSSVGTGIGLHLTHSLVELHHGDIRVEDNPDGTLGTRSSFGCRWDVNICAQKKWNTTKRAMLSIHRQCQSLCP